MAAIKGVLVVFLVLLAVPLLPLGCGKSESDSDKIRQVVEEGIAAYNERDFEKCLTYAADLDEEKKAKLTEMLPGLRDMLGRVTLVEMENIEVGGSGAKADVTGTAQGQTLTVTVRFREEDGVWRVITEGIL